ncbi:MAG: DUF6079 family protein [Prochlorotrichaceae cyanobacterium]
MTLIKDLIHIPDRVQKGDFVLRLTEGVTEEKAEQTVKDYVVTPALKDCFDNALSFIQSAIQSNTSKATYLHGSFGSGKSHFMALLHLILEGNIVALRVKELAPIINKHNPWIEGKKFLLVPYHMIGAQDMESGILGGYVDFILRTHPEAPIPAVYRAEGLFQDAQSLRESMGDEAFFKVLNDAQNSGWGDVATGWDADRFEEAKIAPPGSEKRSKLISDLIKTFFSSYNIQMEKQGEAFLSLDKGLSVISQHAAQLGYSALILFLDELILWLASRATDLKFIHAEVQKLTKLVEAQNPDRPIPVISFVARQRDPKELVGEFVTGADRFSVSESLKHGGERFHNISLEDRNLPAIAEKRVLKPKNEEARQLLNAAFESQKMRESVMTTLLTSEGDRQMFRQVYPFSPALVQTLIAVSSVLQRERTALKIMMQLLVDQRDLLTVGDIVPVGDLFDVVAHGDEAFSPDMARHFDNAKRLYHHKLLPTLEQKHGNWETLETLPPNDPKRIAFRNDDRLVKTLLLSALVPEVESLRNLNAERLAALNHGTVKTPIPGREAGEVLQRCRKWAAQVGEIRIGEESSNPTISVQLSGVDTESILAQADREDSKGNRERYVRQFLCRELQLIDDKNLLTEQEHSFDWKNTRRTCKILFRNIRDEDRLPDGDLDNPEDADWKLIIDFPFDEPDRNPRDDVSRLQSYQDTFPQGAKTLCWLPQFLSEGALKDLGKLVILDHILTGDHRFTEYTQHLSPQDRQTAKSLLENQRSVLQHRVKSHLETAYGLSSPTPDSIDLTHNLELNEQFSSLKPGFTPKPPVASNLLEALRKLLDQALQNDFPAAPEFEAEVKSANLQKILPVVNDAAQTSDGRVFVDPKLRPLMRQIAVPLKLGEMGYDATHFLLGQGWKNHFNPKVAELGSQPLKVSNLRQWIDQPQPMGLPPEAQNLIILTYAEQTTRIFHRHGLALHPQPTLKAIDDECELKEQKLPEEAQWKTALQRAEHIFKISVSPLRKASTVESLESQVKQKAEESRQDCQDYLEALRSGLNRFDLTVESDRFLTANATLSLLEQICTAQPQKVLDTLTEATIATTETAMGTCIAQAASLVPVIKNANWALIEQMRDLEGDYQTEAQDIYRPVMEALNSDEHVRSLKEAVKAGTASATTLVGKITKAVKSSLPTHTPTTPTHPTSPLGTSVTPAQPQSKPISGETQANLNLEQAEKLLSDLKQQYSTEQIQLTISWQVIPQSSDS